MLNNYKIVVLIPAYNEENSVGKVISELPKKIIDEVVVINNNSNDNTVVNAKKAGATVLNEINQGYGFACLKGISYLNELVVKPDIVVFLDADYSDYPEEIPKLIEPIVYDNFDMVIGSRASGNREKNSMTPQQIFGNWLATKLLKLLYNVKYTDLGPFRAIKYTKLIDLKMNDTTYGWTVEMQVKASKKNYKVCEVPVTYRKRIGHSKISGTIKGTFMAGYKIITTIFKYL
jgi:glycosyltransferase involved in cell wall biosynthesis